MIAYEGKSNDVNDIVQCAETILTTPYGSMPYMRDFGITLDVLAMDTPSVQDDFFNQAVDQMETWEERAIIRQVDAVLEDGKIKPKVVLEDGE